MVTRIRKGSRRHVFLREHRKAKELSAIRMADRLGIERESYYRLERHPEKLSAGELAELADALNIEPEALWRPPEGPPSIDALLRDAPDDLKDMAADIVKRLMAQRR